MTPSFFGIPPHLATFLYPSTHSPFFGGFVYPPSLTKRAVKLWYFRFQTWWNQNECKEILLIDKVV